MPDKLHAALERHTGTDGGLCVFCGGRPCDAARALAEIERLEAENKDLITTLREFTVFVSDADPALVDAFVFTKNCAALEETEPCRT